MSIDINCPYCKATQSDAHNGGDPGPWWNDSEIPAGQIEHNCEACTKEFIIDIEWTPTFEAREIDEEN